MRKLALAVLVLLFAPAAFAGDARIRVTLKPEVIDVETAARELAATYAAKLVKVEDGNVILELSIARSGLVARDPHVAAVTVLGSVDAAPVSRPVAPHPSAALRPRANNTCTPPGLPCSTGTYEYDGSGNIKRIGNDVFVYDEFNRLKTATLPSAGGVGETYTYDGFGNMQSIVAAPAAGRPDVTTNKATNHLSEAGYDSAGNVNSWPGHTYKYDAANMLVEMVGTQGDHAAYVYTADDERIAVLEIVPGGYNGTWRIRGLDNKVLREFAESSGSWTWTRDYLYRGGQLLTSFAGAPGGAERRYDYHLDHLGTPRLITDASGRKVSAHNYYPFGGEITWNEGINETFTFTGHERDSSLTTTSQNQDYWYYMHARYDSPNLSRFLSVDRGAWNAKRPQSLNRYAYAFNSPLRYMDPDGLEPLDPTIRAFLERWYQTDFSRVQVHGGFFAHILANRALAITFGNHIFMSSAGWQQYKAVHDAAAAIQRVIEGVGLVGHEVTHTLQARPMGTLSFVLSYLHEWASVGFDYNKIPYELQAYANESNIVAFLLQNPDIVKSIQNGTYAPAPRSGTYGGASINIFNPVTLTLQSDRTFDICGTDPVCQNVVGFYVRRE